MIFLNEFIKGNQSFVRLRCEKCNKTFEVKKEDYYSQETIVCSCGNIDDATSNLSDEVFESEPLQKRSNNNLLKQVEDHVSNKIETLASILNGLGYLSAIIIFIAFIAEDELFWGILYTLIAVLSFQVTVYFLRGIACMIKYLKIICENTKK